MISKKNAYLIKRTKRYHNVLALRSARDGSLPVAANSGGGVWMVVDVDGYFERSNDGLKAWSPRHNCIVFLKPISDEVAADRTLVYLDQLESDADIPF